MTPESSRTFVGWGRRSAIAGGLLVAGAGLLAPSGWYAPVLAPGASEMSLSGLDLLRLVSLMWGAFILTLGVTGWRYERLPPSERLLLPEPPMGSLTPSVAVRYLIGLTLVAAVLRFWNVGSDLWLDEIAPIQMYRDLSPLQIAISYIAPNNHLLNTLLVRLSTSILGETEFAARLPAVLFGIASIPALYYLARQAMDREGSLLAAALLSISYHHIWFSQNARGYAPYIFFALVSTALLSQALRQDRLRDWLPYVLATVLGFASILISVFLVATQVGVAACALIAQRRRGATIVRLASRLLVVFSLVGLMCLQLYAAIIPQAYALLSSMYVDPAAGASLISLTFLRSFADGLAGAVARVSIPLLLVGLAVATPILLAGLVRLMRANWVVTTVLVGALVVQVGAMVARGLVGSPRMFLLVLPVSLLIMVMGSRGVAVWLESRFKAVQGRTTWITTTVVALIAAAFVAPLSRYYAIPKQDYRGSLSFIATEAHDGPVIVLHLMESGYRFYVDRLGLENDVDFRYVRTADEFELLLDEVSDQNILAVTTLHPFLRDELPTVWARLITDFEEIKAFPASLGDGAVVVWSRTVRRPVT